MSYQKINEGLVTLGDLIKTQKGFAFKSSWFSDEGRKIVKVSNFSADSVDLSSLAHIPEELAQKYERYRLATGDVLIQTVGSWPSNPASVVGKVVKVPSGAEGALLNQNAVKLTPLPGVYKAYLYYALKSSTFSNYIVGTAQGAASQASVTLDSIKGYCFNLPSFATQQRIASILSVYDDLIENNTRRIEILEEMARRLYEEWFVHFRFPGHEEVSFKESELGEIPEGWRIGRLGDLVENVKISSKAGSQLSEREYVPIDCIARKSLALPEAKPWEDAKSSLVLFEEDDILFGAMRPYFHKVAVAPVPGVTRTTCFVLRARQKEVWAYAALTVFKEETVAHASAHTRGATIPYAVWDDSLEDLTVLIPPAEILQTFDAKVAPMLQWIKGQFKRQRNLRAQRDLLLPKLVSGEIDVSDIPMPEDKEVEAA